MYKDGCRNAQNLFKLWKRVNTTTTNCLLNDKATLTFYEQLAESRKTCLFGTEVWDVRLFSQFWDSSSTWVVWCLRAGLSSATPTRLRTRGSCSSSSAPRRRTASPISGSRCMKRIHTKVRFLWHCHQIFLKIRWCITIGYFSTHCHLQGNMSKAKVMRIHTG